MELLKPVWGATGISVLRSAGVATATLSTGWASEGQTGGTRRGPLSKQRNRYLQTVLVEAAKLAPRWNPQLKAVHQAEIAQGSNRNRASLAVARKLVAYLLAVDKSREPFRLQPTA